MDSLCLLNHSEGLQSASCLHSFPTGGPRTHPSTGTPPHVDAPFSTLPGQQEASLSMVPKLQGARPLRVQYPSPTRADRLGSPLNSGQSPGLSGLDAQRASG